MHDSDTYEENETDPPGKKKYALKLSKEQLEKLSQPVAIGGDGGALGMIVGGPIKGINYLAKMARNPNFVASTTKKIGDFWEYTVKISGSKGSFTVYKKYLNTDGKTIKMFHDTYDKTYRFMHREIMNGQERMKIWYDGTRQWFSKWK